MTVHQAKTQISLGIRPVWSEFSLCALWVAKDPRFLQADSLTRIRLLPSLIAKYGSFLNKLEKAGAWFLLSVTLPSLFKIAT